MGGLSGIGRRRPRLSDQETERRMLETAAAAVAEAGLTVSLEHIRLEDVIREAGVSRSTVYRRWPQKEMFLGDLLLELARARAPLSSLGGAEVNDAVRRTVLERLDLLETADGRQRLLAELLRTLAEEDVRRIRASSQWRTYLALTATFVSLPDGDLRDRVQEELARSEQEFVEAIASSARAISSMFGLRLRSGVSISYDDIANLIHAFGRGMVIKTLSAPELATRRVEGKLYGDAEAWSLSALGLFSVVATWLEPDPEIVWDRERIDMVRKQLESEGNLLEAERE
jgi:AcrR family transcriptional regulator